MYEIDLLERLLDLAHPLARKPVFLSFLLSALEPVQSYNDQFVLDANDLETEAKVTGQTMVLEAWLNKQFPNPGDQIYIATPSEYSQVYSYYTYEGQPPVHSFFVPEGQAGPATFYTSEGQLVYDFIVMVPSAQIFDQDQMRAIVQRFKLGGKRFTISIF